MNDVYTWENIITDQFSTKLNDNLLNLPYHETDDDIFLTNTTLD